MHMYKIINVWLKPATYSGIPYSGYFSGGKIFVVFVVGQQTTKYLPTKCSYKATPINSRTYVRTVHVYTRTWLSVQLTIAL